MKATEPTAYGVTKIAELFPSGCLVRIFSSVICPLSREYSYALYEFGLLPSTQKHAFAEAVVNSPSALKG